MDEVENVDFFLMGIKDGEIIVKHPVSKEIFDDVFFYIYKSVSDEGETLEKETIDRLNYLVKKHHLSLVNLSRLLKTTDEIINAPIGTIAFQMLSFTPSFGSNSSI